MPVITVAHKHRCDLSTTSTLNMSNETFKTNHGSITKWTKDNYPVLKQNIRRALISNKAYDLSPVPSLCPQQDYWPDCANDAMARIHIVCSEDLLALIEGLPRQGVGDTRDHLHNASAKVGRTTVLRRFTATPC
jgi:hypothetical protein